MSDRIEELLAMAHSIEGSMAGGVPSDEYNARLMQAAGYRAEALVLQLRESTPAKPAEHRRCMLCRGTGMKWGAPGEPCPACEGSGQLRGVG